MTREQRSKGVGKGRQGVENKENKKLGDAMKGYDELIRCETISRGKKSRKEKSVV